MNIETLYLPVKEGIKEVDKRIHNIFKKDFFPEVSPELLQGKRLRPLLVLYTSFAFEELTENKVDVAAAVELVHFGSLIHDDIVDRAELRRNAKTLNSFYGDHIALLIGDYVFSKAMEYISNTKKTELFEILSKTFLQMCEGEIIDEFLDREKKFELENYLILIKKKTASLFSASCEMGGVISEYKNIKIIKKFGEKFGILFQMLDDLHDFYTCGEDIRKSKITLPHVLFKDEIKKVFPEFVFKKDYKLSKKVRNYLLKKKIMEKSYDFISDYFKELKELIFKVDKPLKDYLYSFIEYLEKNKIEIFNEKRFKSLQI